MAGSFNCYAVDGNQSELKHMTFSVFYLIFKCSFGEEHFAENSRTIENNRNSFLFSGYMSQSMLSTFRLILLDYNTFYDDLGYTQT